MPKSRSRRVDVIGQTTTEGQVSDKWFVWITMAGRGFP
jgi:hypothetical protein